MADKTPPPPTKAQSFSTTPISKIQQRFNINIREFIKSNIRAPIEKVIKPIEIENIPEFSKLGNTAHELCRLFLSAMNNPSVAEVNEATKSRFSTCLLVPVVASVRENHPAAIAWNLKLDSETELCGGKGRITPVIFEIKLINRIFSNQSSFKNRFKFFNRIYLN